MRVTERHANGYTIHCQGEAHSQHVRRHDDRSGYIESGKYTKKKWRIEGFLNVFYNDFTMVKLTFIIQDSRGWTADTGFRCLERKERNTKRVTSEPILICQIYAASTMKMYAYVYTCCTIPKIGFKTSIPSSRCLVLYGSIWYLVTDIFELALNI